MQGRLGRLFSFKGQIPKMEPQPNRALLQMGQQAFEDTRPSSYSRRPAREPLASNFQPLTSSPYQYSNRKTYEKLELNVSHRKQMIGCISNRNEIALRPR